MLRRLVACLVVPLGLVAADGVRAAQIHVDPIGRLRTVTAAIDSAAFGDTLVLAHHTYFENPRIVDKDLWIISAPGGRAILDGAPNGGGGNAGSVLRTVRSFVHLQDLIIQNGVPLNVGAGVMLFGGHVTMQRVTLRGNVYGALSVQSGLVPGTMSLADCEILGNAFGLDGLVSNRIIRTRFEGNDFALRLQGAVELEDVEILNNGGPLLPETGGAVLTAAFGRLERVVVRGNKSFLQFGGLRLKRGPFQLIDCDISNNISEFGPGGLACVGVDAELVNTTIRDNFARGVAQSVAGLLVDNRSDVVVRDCRIENNDSEERGGGISVQRDSNLRVLNSHVTGNSSLQKGGGVYVLQSVAHLEKVVIADNRSVGGGGVVVESGETNLVSCTIAGNRADGAGGLLFNNASGRIEKSIVAFNEGVPGLLCAGGSVTVSCTNVFGNGGEIPCGTDLGGNLAVDPGFCTFEPETRSFDLRLQRTSPLVDAAGCGLIGALGPGDCTTQARSITWSRLKQLYGTGRAPR